MYYLIRTEYVGLNQKSSDGRWLGDTRVMGIYTQPGRTNLGGRVLTEGWLGTTNDISAVAYGEYATIEEARAAAWAQGFTVQKEPSDPWHSTLVEEWVTPAAARIQTDAGDWLLSGPGSARDFCQEHGITGATTDDELAALAEAFEEEACAEGLELHGTLGELIELRNSLREEV